MGPFRRDLDPQQETWRYFLNSLVITVSTTVITVTLGAFAAYSLARLRLPYMLSLVIGLAFLIVRFCPKITVALPYFHLMCEARLLDTHLAVIVAHGSIKSTFVVWLLVAERIMALRRHRLCGLVRDHLWPRRAVLHPVPVLGQEPLCPAVHDLG